MSIATTAKSHILRFIGAAEVVGAIGLFSHGSCASGIVRRRWLPAWYLK